MVSIVILNYFHPELIKICLETLRITEDVKYEVIVVDNGSDEATVAVLKQLKENKLLDKLVLMPENNYFSEGNNIGVRNADPSNPYVLLLNSDVAFLRPDWLSKMVQWAEGTIVHKPSIWPHHPAQPAPGAYDVVSLGWSHDAHVEGRVRPEGWCCLYRRTMWEDMSIEFPWLYGIDLQITNIARRGGRVGVLSQYGSYLVHREGGSTDGPKHFDNARAPDLPGWYSDVHIESLDFELGPNEHDSYLWW